MPEPTIAAPTTDARPDLGAAFSMSWIDRLSSWVAGLPGPAWIYCLAAGLAVATLLHLARWASGASPWGVFATGLAFGPMFGAYIMAMYIHLIDVADRCLTAYRPALDPAGAMYAEARLGILYSPARPMLIANLIGIAIFTWLWTATPILLREILVGRPLADIPFLIVGYTNAILLSAVIFEAMRRMILAARLERRAPRLNLLQPDPVYAFSELWAHTTVGGMLVQLAYVGLGFAPGMETTRFALGLPLAGFLVAVTYILAPLATTHRRLAGEKKRLLAEAHRRLEMSIQRLHANVDKGDLAEMDQLSKALGSLTAEIDLLNRLPTWPWRPGFIASVVTALLLPIGLWLIQQLLEPYVGAR